MKSLFARILLRGITLKIKESDIVPAVNIPYSPFDYKRRKTHAIQNIGGTHPPVVVADFMHEATITPESLLRVGYQYDEITDKWNIGDAAADYIYTGEKIPDFDLPGTCRVIINYEVWKNLKEEKTIAGEEKYFPLLQKNSSGNECPLFTDHEFFIAEFESGY